MTVGRRRVVAVWVALGLLSCAGGAALDASACLDRTESIRYVERLRQSILVAWDRPRGAPGTLTVFGRLDEDGRLQRPTVRVNSRLPKTGPGIPRCQDSLECRLIREPLTRSIEDAIRQAEPIGPPPEAAACLFLRTLQLEFSTREPVLREPDPEPDES